MMQRLPMFPLGSVLLPGDVMQLHIFEPRYREMIAACRAAEHPDFGVVLIERGSEVGGGEQRANVATVARIVQLAASPDGRYGLLAMGMYRVAVREWLPDDPYPVALVEELPDTPPSPEELSQWPLLYKEATVLTQLCVSLGKDVGALDESAVVDAVDDPARGSYQLAATAPLGPFDRYQVLRRTSVLERLQVLVEALHDQYDALSFTYDTGEDDSEDD
jgi:Lon protease-like protein